MNALLKLFMGNECGATAIEYGLIGSAIAVAILSGASGAGTALESTFNTLATAMSASGGSAPPSMPTGSAPPVTAPGPAPGPGPGPGPSHAPTGGNHAPNMAPGNSGSGNRS